jgi:hypothetical protein
VTGGGNKGKDSFGGRDRSTTTTPVSGGEGPILQNLITPASCSDKFAYLNFGQNAKGVFLFERKIDFWDDFDGFLQVVYIYVHTFVTCQFWVINFGSPSFHGQKSVIIKYFSNLKFLFLDTADVCLSQFGMNMRTWV